jgi:fumarate reductase flavoprotein subunit
LQANSASSFDVSVQVLVIGGGAGGAVAALAAAAEGAEVLLVEQDDRPGGSTGMSQGLMCAAGTASQAAHGIDDGPDLFYADIMAKTRGQADPVIARAIANEAGPTLEWLIATHGMPWELDTRFRAVYGNSRLRVHGWPGHGGLDMIQFLHGRLGDTGIDVLMQTRLVGIEADADGRVAGVALRRADGAVERLGCGALILACGGFGANAEMVAAHMPEAAQLRYNGHAGNRGDAIRLAAPLGAALGDLGSYQGYAMLTDPQGISVPPGVLIEGGVLINRLGQRFTDETLDIAGMVHPLAQQPDGLGWVVFDAGIEARCAHIPESKALRELNAARQAEDAAGLAAAIGVPADALAATLADAKGAQSAGRPDAQGRVWGADLPPGSPLRALRVTGALYHTQGGLQTDGEARVLRPDGSALPNLFAAGGAARGVAGPSSWGYLPAIGLCAAVTTGRIAGRAAARVCLFPSFWETTMQRPQNACFRAIRMERFAPSFRQAAGIVELPLGPPGSGELRVRNHYCGVNAIFDTQIARNAVDYVKLRIPSLTGVEALGVVESCGAGVRGFAPGDAVVTTRFPGGYRDWNIAPEAHFVRVPNDHRDWLALASTGVSATVALEHVGALRDGETVAISAAAGGLGHFLVQLALLRGCHVVALCGGPRKAAFLRGLGAHRVIDYRAESVADVLSADYRDKLDVAIDTVSGAIFDAFLDNIAPHGRLVVGGAAADLEGRPEIITGPRIAHKLYYKGASVRGFMNGLLTNLWPEARARVFGLYEAGRLRVVFDEERFVGLDRVFDAVEHLLSGRSIGKVSVDLRGGA